MQTKVLKELSGQCIDTHIILEACVFLSKRAKPRCHRGKGEKLDNIFKASWKKKSINNIKRKSINFWKIFLA